MNCELFNEVSPDRYKSILPKIYPVSTGNVNINIWEIDQTITQLSYLTHNFFRYYGKFPSTVASQLLESYPAPLDAILLDNFAGSGTSMVEASRRNIPSVGIDVNPLSVLAAKVKTKNYNIKNLREKLKKILNTISSNETALTTYIPDEAYLNKWFFPETLEELTKLKSVLLIFDDDEDSDFFSLAFLAIIRRVSRAFDGEVRPHINKTKKAREPLSAFVKKVTEMIKIQEDFQLQYPHKVCADTILCDARSNYKDQLPNGNYWLVISHPPYLNCFDYLPVFKLELQWCEGFSFLGKNYDESISKKGELKSWPASDNLNNNYYNGLREAYQRTYDIQHEGGILAVVIGDCTIKGKLEPVHLKVIEILKEIGYRNKEINYRTTHYSTGKYSYQHRADYHSEQEEKRDAILIFEK